MSQPKVVFEEESAAAHVATVPLSHLSIEVGRVSPAEASEKAVRALFDKARPLVLLTEHECETKVRKPARISRCVVVDDYSGGTRPPSDLLPWILTAAEAAKVRIDYVVRESASVAYGGVPLAELVLDRIVDDPPPGSDGTRKTARETGWLCNGERSPHQGASEAMHVAGDWRPPTENAARHHSIFMDVQLWAEREGAVVWSASYLSAVRQLLRLGVLRDKGSRVAVAKEASENAWPAAWDQLPGIIRLPDIPTLPGVKWPFSAYRTFSVLSTKQLPIEAAARTILSQVSIERAVLRQLDKQVANDRLTRLPQLVDRIEYAFATAAWP